MSSYVKTVGGLDKVLTTCTSMGERYQPNKEALMPTALSTLLERSQESLKAVTGARTNYRLAVTRRAESFAGIQKLAVRVVRMVAASENSAGFIEDATAIKNTFYPPKKSRKAAPQPQTEADQVVKTNRSGGRLSFEQKATTFERLIQVVENMGSYNPNEADLKMDALKATLADLRAKSHAVAQAAIDYSLARIERDKLMFGQDGVRQITKAVKNYIRGAFGAVSKESDHYAQFS